MTILRSELRMASSEFVLAVTTLTILAILVTLALFAPGFIANATDLLDYRKSIFAVIVAVFGGWVRARGACYSGRENLREAAGNMLAKCKPLPEGDYTDTPTRKIPSKVIEWIVKT